MATRSISVAVLADTKELSKNLASAEGDLNKFGSEADKAANKAKESLDGVGEGADTVASKGAQAAGAMSGLGDLIGGPFGNSMMIGGIAMQAAADAGDLLNAAIEGGGKLVAKAGALMKSFANATGLSTAASKVAAVATKAWALAQRGLNLVMAGNPIALTVVALAALAVALVIAYKKSATFRAIVNGAFGAVTGVVKKFIGFFTKTVPEGISKVVNFVKAHWKPIVAIMLGPIGLLVLGITRNLDKIKAGFTNTVNFIKSVPGKIRNLVGNFKDAGSALIQGLINGLKNVGGTIGDIGRAIVDSVIGFLNAHLPHSLSINKGPIHISVPLFPTIPALASGGIVTGPTIALIGEAGPEAVVPLDGRRGFGNSVVINVKVNTDGAIVQTDAELGGRILKAIQSAYEAGELALA